jgi:hypothetical protein
MRRIARSNHFWIGASLAATFWMTASYLPNKILLLITNALMLAGSTAVSIAYVPVAVQKIRYADATEFQCIALGIAYVSTCNALWRMLSIFWLTSGQDPILVNNDIVAFLQSGIFLGYAYHLASPGAIGGMGVEERLPRLKWIVIGFAVGVAVFLAALLALYNPDTHWLAELVGPYIPR